MGGARSVKNSFLFFLILSIILFANACAFTDQKAFLNPMLAIESENIGKGQQVGIKVVDERTDQNLGYRGAAFVGKGGVIKSDQNVAKLLAEKIRNGLKMKGFEPTSYADGLTKTIKVELRSLEYFTSTGFWTGGVHAKSALKVVAKNSNKEYEELYRVEKEERIVFVPGAESNEKLINSTLSEVLQKLFDDSNLFKFLVN